MARTWFKQMHGFYRHPKTIQAGEDAANLFVRGVDYCTEYLTDGFIPDESLDVITHKRRRRAHAADLVRVGYWTKVEGGWRSQMPQVTTAAQDASARRHRRMRNASGVFDLRAANARVEFYGGKCWICRDAAFEVLDHVKPLSKGGSNWPANLRPACVSCNSRKSATWPFAPEGIR